jgi:hypothetical protein
MFAKSTLYLGWQKKNFLSWLVQRANLSTSTQLSLTEISTFCSKKSIFTTSTQLSLTKIFTFCRKFQKKNPPPHSSL